MRSLIAASALALLLTACGGGGSTSAPAPIGGGTPQTPSTPGGGYTGPVRGIGLPEAVETVPPKAGATSFGATLRSALTAADALPADSDYAKATTVTQLAHPALRQLDLLNVILNALTYAHHDDPAVVDQGPYSVMVPWVDRPFGDDRPVDRLDRWVVDSRMVDDGRVPVNRVRLWASRFFAPVSGTAPMVQFEIREAPRRNADGSYADYGVWTMSGKFTGAPRSDDEPFMTASAEREPSGAGVVKFHFSGPPAEVERTVVLVTTGATGYGWARYWAPTLTCSDLGCGYPPAEHEAVYAFDADTVTLSVDGGAPESKNRNDVADLVTALGFYDATTGSATVIKNASPYQIPIEYDGPAGKRSGWATGAGVYPADAFPPGATVTAPTGPYGETRTYTVSPTMHGVLQREDFPPASLQEVKGIVTQKLEPLSGETLWFDGTSWCRNPTRKPPELGGGVDVCGPDSGLFTEAEFAAVEQKASDLRYYTWMAEVVPDGQNVLVAYLANGPAGPGIYETKYDTWAAALNEPRVFQQGDLLSVMVQRSHWVYFDGSGWMEKLAVAKEPGVWMPTFDPAGDTAWEFPVGDSLQLYWDLTEYTVARPDASTWDVRFKFTRWSNPSNAWRFTSGIRVISPMPPTGQYYVFDNDPASPTFLKLLGYDAYPPPGTPGTVVETVAAADVVYGVTNVRYTWNPTLTANYLMDGASYVPFSDTIRFNPVHLRNRAGEDHAYLLRAWGPYIQTIPGLVATREALAASGQQMTRAIADRVVAIPTGTVVEEYRPVPGSNVPVYVLKPLYVDEYLTVSDAPALDLTRAATLRQQVMPAYVEPAPLMTGIPSETVAPLRFQ